jgi:hypothetical protein
MNSMMEVAIDVPARPAFICYGNKSKEKEYDYEK